MSNLRTVPIAALTTVFTHSCSESWLLTMTRAPSQFPPFPTAGPASCELPSWNDNIAAQGIRFYSPAICPSGFFIGPNCGVTKTRTNEGFPPVTAGETVAYCVPSEFTCTTDTTDFRGGVWGFATATAPRAQVTVAPAIQIRWRDSDLSILQTHPLTPGLLLAGDRSLPTPTDSPAARPTGDTFMRFSTIFPAPSGTTIQPPPAASTTTTAAPSTRSTQPPSTTTTTSSDPFATRSPGGLGGSPFNSPSNNAADDQHGSEVAIVLGATFTALAFSVIALYALNRFLRKRRQCHHPDSEKPHLTPIGVGVWARCGQKAGSWGVILRRKSERRVYQKQRDGAEAGVGVVGRGGRDRARPVTETIQEVDGAPPVGTRGNPAELEAAELEAASRRNTQRWSWMSHLSDMMGGRKSMRTPLSRSESRRCDTSSIFVGRTSADWEAFSKERWPNGLTVPPQTYRGGNSNSRSNSWNQRSSGMTMTRSLSRRPSPPSTSRLQALAQLQSNSHAAASASTANAAKAKGHTRNKSSQFRLSERSDGTFGEMPRSPVFGGMPSPTSPTSPVSPVSPLDHLSSRSSSRRSGRQR